jgi:hypothetical protein
MNGLPVATAYAAPAAPPRLAVVSAQFTPGGTWPAASAVTLTVQFDQPVLLASWQWVGADGQPVAWAGTNLPPSDLKPASDRWAGRAGVPPLPGTYGVRVTARAANAATAQTFTLAQRGTVVADPEPFTRGLAFVRDGNLWLRSLDLTRQRAITFYGRPGTVGMPAWSPDGRQIAFIRDQGTIGGTPDLWVIRPDGTGARRVAAASPGRALGYPGFAADGTLYVAESRELTFGGVSLGDTWDLGRVDPATGKRTPVIPGASMPAVSPDGQRVVYIRQDVSSDGGIQSGMAVADLDGGHEQVLVTPRDGIGVYAPAWSPDGATIVFAAMGMGGAAGRVPGLAAPVRHGGFWDLWTVPARGGTPRLLSAVQEDLPWPQWEPGAGQVIFLSPTGWWRVPAAGGPPELLLNDGEHSELNLFAPTPRPAPALSGPSRCFAETDQCLRGLFLQYWDSHGGLTQFGFPITPELTEEGRTVQYTERARLEWHPENRGSPSEVLLGRLGADIADARASAGEAPFVRQTLPTSPTGIFFPQTGHTLAPPLRSYWESHGGLPVFGFPLSEAFMERNPSDGKTYLVQYCERNRLEYHPEYAGTDSEVLLGLLGVQEYARRYGR